MPAKKIIFPLAIMGLLIAILATTTPAGGETPQPEINGKDSNGIKISRSHALSIAAQVDARVNKDFYEQSLAKSSWKEAYSRLLTKLAKKENQEQSLSLSSVESEINLALQSLKSSHCQFVSTNDESFYFLHSLFATISSSFSKGPHAWAKPLACTGLVTGGCDFAANQVRYVLDGSAAARAGLQVGDKILTVCGRPYNGYLDFIGREGERLPLEISRADLVKRVSLTPVREHMYKSYVDATRASVRKINRGGHVIGYIHLWAGGTKSADAVNEILTSELKNVDGLVYDLRDGYGGASLSDLDLFFRPAAAYPDLVATDAGGKSNVDRLFFDKPVVLLINSGSRSGKELLAYSLKNSGRALLVGETTAGAVLAGRLYPLDQNCALYLAINDIKLVTLKNKKSEEQRLEGLGVAPDIEVRNVSHDQNGYGLQLNAAIEALEKRLSD